jgi:hypothetical protein
MKPGVGNYADQVYTSRKAPQYGFGTTKRPVFAAQKFPNPGPGTYKVPAKVGDTQGYAIPSMSHHESKYV